MGTKSYFIFFMLCIVPFCAKAQNIDADIKQLLLEVGTLTKEVSILKDSQQEIQTNINELQTIQKSNINRLSEVEEYNYSIQKTIDSIKTDCSMLAKSQKRDNEQLTAQIGETKEKIKINQDLLSNRTNIGSILFVIILIIIITIIIVFLKKFNKGTSSINEVRKAQNKLEQAQKSLQEESVKLDNKLLEVVEQQMKAVPVTTNNAASVDHSLALKVADEINNAASVDHSLALKVADEIVRIELNLSRMDPSIKGYKQLAKAVQRIKDNFLANGYEIVDMLGKPYIAGMKAAVTFVIDENLSRGEQVITKVIKPQINYQQQMIQAAQIEVSQSE